MSDPRHLLDCPDRSNLGRRLTLPPAGAFETLLDVRGEDTAARVVTVSLSIAPTVRVDGLGPDDLAARRDEVRARALIEAGVGGHSAKVELDVGAGVHFSAAVSSLRVSAKNDGGAAIEVGAFVGYGSTNGRPRLTRIGPTLGVRANWVLDVPAYASAVEVLRPEDREVLVEVSLGRAGDRWLYSDRVLAGDRMAPLPLANGCRRARLTHVAGAPFVPVLLFALSF